MKVELNTCLLPIIDVGMYESILSPDTVFGDWLSTPGLMDVMTKDEIDYCKEAPNQYFNIDAYKKLVATYAMEFISAFFKDIRDVVKVTVGSNAYIDSPPYYNYRSDMLCFEIVISKAKIAKIKRAARTTPGFHTWLRETYKSRPGYICAMPSTIECFIKGIAGHDIDRALAAYFTFLLRTKVGYAGNEEFGNEYKLYEQISSNHAIDEFISDERFQAIMFKAYEARGAGG